MSEEKSCIGSMRINDYMCTQPTTSKNWNVAGIGGTPKKDFLEKHFKFGLDSSIAIIKNLEKN